MTVTVTGTVEAMDGRTTEAGQSVLVGQSISGAPNGHHPATQHFPEHASWLKIESNPAAGGYRHTLHTHAGFDEGRRERETEREGGRVG
jgi:hypothetical protein